MRGLASPHPILGAIFCRDWSCSSLLLGSDMFLAGCWYIAVFAVFPFGCCLARVAQFGPNGWAGFTGDNAPRTMFPFIVVRPKMLRIMAGTHQMGSCTRELDYVGDDLTMFPYAAQCLELLSTCHASAYGALVIFYGPCNLAGHMFVVVT